MMPGLKIIGKIELPERKKRPEEYRPLLEKKLAVASQETNENYGREFLESDGSLRMMDNPELEADRQFVADLEEHWAAEHQQTVAEWRQRREKNPAVITEMAVTVALSHLLQERFIVARASAYDDYRYGVDNVLIDRQTGAVVCGFDEVLGFTGDDGGVKKSQKIKETLARGGSSLKYGATIEEGKLVSRELRHLPTFYLSLSKEELDGLLSEKPNEGGTTENERRLGQKIVESLEQQYQEAGAIATDGALRENLEKFSVSLTTIKEQANKK